MRQGSIKELDGNRLMKSQQIVAHGDGSHVKHPAHVRGVAAILSQPDSPFDLVAATQLFQLCNPLGLDKPTDVCVFPPFASMHL
jgi:hypothetical protein